MLFATVHGNGTLTVTVGNWKRKGRGKKEEKKRKNELVDLKLWQVYMP